MKKCGAVLNQIIGRGKKTAALTLQLQAQFDMLQAQVNLICTLQCIECDFQQRILDDY